MKKYLFFITAFIAFTGKALFSQNTVLFESRYFSFQSNPSLNAHLFLYNKAMGCKFKKIHEDSLAYYSFKDKIKTLKPADLATLNPVLRFYMDSLLNKDLLLDSLMRDFSDKLGDEKNIPVKWQRNALEKVNTFKPYFTKLFWPAIDAENKTWLKVAQPQIIRLETAVIPELERIYQEKLPAGKIIIDLTSYATWTGAYSYDNTFCHVIFSSTHRSNQGEFAAEVVFHETSHFLVRKISKMITTMAKGKDIKQSINLWHNLIFYTTGYVLEKAYAKEAKTFVPYYVQMKFQEKFPDFKIAVEGCHISWDPYIQNTGDLNTAIQKLVAFVSEPK
jgi:hypothetical protein